MRAIFQVLSPGGLYLEGRFNGGFFCVTGLEDLYLEGLIREAYLRNFTVSPQFLEALSSGHGKDQSAFLFFNSWQAKHKFEIFSHSYRLSSFTNSLLKTICSAGSLPLSLMKKI